MDKISQAQKDYAVTRAREIVLAIRKVSSDGLHNYSDGQLWWALKNSKERTAFGVFLTLFEFAQEGRAVPEAEYFPKAEKETDENQ